MTALATDRKTPRREGDMRMGGVAAAQTIYLGGIVMRNAAGHLVKASTALGLVGVGVAEERVVNGGAAGSKSLRYRAGTFLFANSSAADAITLADIGKPAYAVDDQTVAKTSGTNTRSIAGFVAGVEAHGVWIEFDEVKVQTYLAGVSLPE